MAHHATPASKRDRIEALEEKALRNQYDWPRHGRPNQLAPPGDWFVWFLKAGRGFGKTLSGAQWVRSRVEAGAKLITLVAHDPHDARTVMIEGPAGLMAISPPWNKPVYEPALRRLTWPSGAQALIYSDESAGQLRGAQGDTAWCDEFAKYRHAQDTWDNLMFGMRQSQNPRVCVTSTPTPIPAVLALLKSPSTVVTGGSTFENEANLPASFVAEMRRRYEGTSLGRQELYADLIEQAEGALWTRERIEVARVHQLPPMRRIVVAIDPAVTSKESSDETGIIVAGVGEDGDGYVLDDLSGTYSPNDWATRAVNAFKAQKADRIVAEVNNGGEMVEFTVRTVDPNVPYRAVHASRGKRTRAEPVAALYEQHRVHHVGTLPALESQMCIWDASKGEASPDRVDALVWALTEVLLAETAGAGFLAYAKDVVAKSQPRP